MGYNLKGDGWLINFTDVRNQFIRGDAVPWKGGREKRPEFFSILFSALMHKDDIILDWQCGVGSFFFSCLCFLIFLFHSYLVSFPFIYVSSPYRISLL